MISNKINKVSGSRSLQSEVQSIAGEIAHSPISPKKYQVLSKKLDCALQTLKGLEAKTKTASVFAKAQTEHLKEQMVKLYGDLENRLVEREVSQIQEESRSLKKGRLTLKAIQKLENHIQELEQNHLTAIPDRRIIADAKQALVEARAKLEGKPVVRHFDLMASQKPMRDIEETALLPDEVEELFDVARAIYNRNMRDAKARFASLSESQKNRFEKHMQNLLASPFEDPLETMQALIATANDLVENGETYLTEAQIDQLFLGLSQLGDEDRGSKIIAFKAS